MDALKPGSAVTWQGEPWRVLGFVPTVGGGRAVQLEALTRDAFATTAEGAVTPAPEVDVAAVLAERGAKDRVEALRAEFDDVKNEGSPKTRERLAVIEAEIARLTTKAADKEK